MLPPEEREPEEPTAAATAASEKGGKGKAKAKGKGAAAASTGRKGSKGGVKPALEVRQTEASATTNYLQPGGIRSRKGVSLYQFHELEHETKELPLFLKRLVMVDDENRTHDPKTHVLPSTPFAKVLVCWATGSRLTNRAPKLSLIALN